MRLRLHASSLAEGDSDPAWRGHLPVGMDLPPPFAGWLVPAGTLTGVAQHVRTPDTGRAAGAREGRQVRRLYSVRAKQGSTVCPRVLAGVSAPGGYPQLITFPESYTRTQPKGAVVRASEVGGRPVFAASDGTVHPDTSPDSQHPATGRMGVPAGQL